MRNFILVIVILIGLISGAANSLELEQHDLATERGQWRLYKRWLSHHKISRSHRQKHRRFNVFKHNARHVLNVNQMNKPYKLRLNMFGDMSNQEFLKLYAPNNITLSKNLYSANNNNNNIDSGFMYQKATNLPNHMDWREKGAVNKIKDQHTCMSCWAFSATAAIEGINQIKTKKLVSLSEQELIDCDPWSNGCYGGFVDSAFDFVYQNGISTQKNYPYYNSQQYCSYSMMMNSPRVTIDGYERVPRNNERALMKAVAHQPVSVAIASSGSDFQFYWKGVFDGYCGPDINHAVVAIGYGTSEDGDDYWLVRNSWGTWWGDDGYIKLKRGLEYPSGQCGIAESPIYPIKNR